MMEEIDSGYMVGIRLYESPEKRWIFRQPSGHFNSDEIFYGETMQVVIEKAYKKLLKIRYEKCNKNT